MNIQRKRVRRGPMAALALGVLALGACEVTNVTDVTEARPVLKMVLGPGAAVLPSGSVALSKIRISGFDFSVVDGFARGTGPDGVYVPVDNPFGASPAFDMGGAVRNSSQDTRLPALVESSAAIGDFWGMFSPAFTDQGNGSWDLFGELVGLAPDATYTVVLARMALQANGELDQQQSLTGRPVTDPDQLTFLGGQTVGYPGIACNFSAFSDVTASTNPVALGVIVTDGEGKGTVDCIVRSTTGDSPWALNDAAGFTAADAPFGSNAAGATLAPGQFNYVLLYEGVPTDNALPPGNPTVRVQIGPDIDAAGNVTNNALSPFPDDVAANPADLPGGVDAFSAPGQMDIEVTGLSSLSGGTYQLWLYSRDGGSYTPADATITVGENMSMGTTFGSPGSSSMVTAKLDDATGLDFGSFSHVVLSVETAAMASPSAARFMFLEYLTSSKNLAEGGMTFGTFDPNGPGRAFSISGSGTGEFYETSLLVDLRRLPAPPDGFHYQSYLASFSGTMVSNSVRLNTLTLDALGNGADRVEQEQASGDFGSYSTYLVVLEPDGLQTLTDMHIQASEDYLGKFSSFFSN